VPREAGAELAQIAEPQPSPGDPGRGDPGRRDPGGGDCRRAQHIERRVMRRQIEREMSAIVDQAEKDDPSLRQPLIDLAIAGAKQQRNRLDAKNDRLRLAVLDVQDKALRAPDRYEKAAAVHNPGADPFGLAATQPGPLEAWIRIEVRGLHAARLTCARRPRNRAGICAPHKVALNRKTFVISFLVVQRTMSCRKQWRRNPHERDQTEACRA
jgi:hypothetical protein